MPPSLQQQQLLLMLADGCCWTFSTSTKNERNGTASALANCRNFRYRKQTMLSHMHAKTDVCRANWMLKCIKSCGHWAEMQQNSHIRKNLRSQHAFIEGLSWTEADSGIKKCLCTVQCVFSVAFAFSHMHIAHLHFVKSWFRWRHSSVVIDSIEQALLHKHSHHTLCWHSNYHETKSWKETLILLQFLLSFRQFSHIFYWPLFLSRFCRISLEISVNSIVPTCGQELQIYSI